MEALHVVYPWVPGRDSIRPTGEVMAAKQRDIAATEGIYDVDDFSVPLFGLPWPQALQRGKVWRHYAFQPNKYPYAVPEGTHHYVLWFPTESAVPAPAVTACCEEAVDRLGGRDFVWYLNPKMTIQRIWHVQVFWV